MPFATDGTTGMLLFLAQKAVLVCLQKNSLSSAASSHECPQYVHDTFNGLLSLIFSRVAQEGYHLFADRAVD